MDYLDAFGDTCDVDRNDVKKRSLRSRQAEEMPTVTLESIRYKMNREDRGTAVIFNQRDFDKRTRLRIRRGGDVEVDNMYTLLEALNFEKIRKYDDLKVEEMKDILLEISEDDHSESDCFVCIILSYGEEGYVYGNDGIITIDELMMNFKGDMCPSLVGKPKLFIIQACPECDEDPDSFADTEEEEEENFEIRKIPTEADFLMAYSVIPGSSEGSSFIQAIRDVFLEKWEEMDVFTMLTRVNKIMAYKMRSEKTKKKRIPCITSMLTKEFFFTK